MPAINFTVFIDKVKYGTKLQTIRKRRKNPIKVGDKLMLYTGQRTKDCKKLMDTVCTQIDTIKISKDGNDIYISESGQPTINRFIGYRVDARFMDDFAERDGFENWEEMHEWFDGKYELPETFKIIHWKFNPQKL